MEVRKFDVAVPEADVDAMYARVRDARWPSDLGNNSWRYGVNRAWLEDLVAYWRGSFDVDGQPIHFVHVRSPKPDATPLLLLND